MDGITKQKVALLFGSFNPMHIGHLAILRYLIANHPECEIRLVVSPESPFKAGLMANAGQRLEAARKYIKENNLNITVSDIEYHLEPPLYTIETLRRLQLSEPDKEFIIIMGADNIAGLNGWYKYEEILSGYEIWVYPRKGFEGQSICYMYDHLPGTKGVKYLEAPLFDISSTEIRNGRKSEHNRTDSQDNRINKALTYARQTRKIEIGRGVVARTAEVFREQFPGKEAIVIADTTTSKFVDFLGLDCRTHIFASGTPAEWKYVEQLKDVLAHTEAIPIALGSGTINDMTKLASYLCGKRYMTVATAVSMDGYASFGASITKFGNKQTFPCTAPQAIIADLDIIATSPPSVVASGYADLFAKITAGADWILSDALGEEPMDEIAFCIAQDGLHESLEDPESLIKGSPTALRKLTEGLILSGLAMQAYPNSSRPASGAEHKFCHLWAMQHHTMYNGRIPSHGFQVSIGTLVSLAYYEQLMKCDIKNLDIGEAMKQWPSISKEEYISPGLLAEQLNTLKNNWDSIKAKLDKQLVSVNQAIKCLSIVGAPTKPEDIDIPRHRMRDCILDANYVRPRFTILDLALRCGKFEEWTSNIFGPDGLWPTD